MIYQQYELTARPSKLASGKWSAEVRIRRNEAVRDFTAGDTFDTREDAVIHALDFGRKIIDGDAPEITGLWIS